MVFSFNHKSPQGGGILKTCLRAYSSLIITPVLVSFVLSFWSVSIGIGHLYVRCLLSLFQRLSTSRRLNRRRRKNGYVEGGPLATPSTDDASDEDLFLDCVDSEDGTVGGRDVPTRRNMVQRMSESCPCPPQLVLDEVASLVRSGLEAILDDDVTKRFASVEELDVWNLLTRTQHNNRVTSKNAWFVWIIGFVLRYFILLPYRFILFIIGLTIVGLFALLMSLPFGRHSKLRFNVRCWMSRVFFRIASRVLSAVITIHNPENKAQPGSICVANHTSPIDVIILSTDGNYALTGQRQRGFFGVLESFLARTGDNIWFDRSESDDRLQVLKRVREYVHGEKQKLPVLLFPEGTCINNTSVMMFRKGCFEIEAPIYPVAIKYDPRLGDPFWNSQRYGLLHYLLLMMTSWAIAVDVYYLPKMERKGNESSIDFAKRVKAEIADAGSFVDMEWDGMLKRSRTKSELREREQRKISKQLKTD